MDFLQDFQDNFAKSLGIAAITVDSTGNPVTKPSGFTDFCMEYTRKSPLGCQRCMAVLAGFAVPHPPIILTEIGQGEEKKIQATIDAYGEVMKQAAGLRPDTVVITSPHTVMYGDYNHISPGREAAGDMDKINITEPDYWPAFVCSGGDCPDTCCQGWDIVIDPATCARYEKSGSREFRKLLSRAVVHRREDGAAGPSEVACIRMFQCCVPMWKKSALPSRSTVWSCTMLSRILQTLRSWWPIWQGCLPPAAAFALPTA